MYQVLLGAHDKPVSEVAEKVAVGKSAGPVVWCKVSAIGSEMQDKSKTIATMVTMATMRDSSAKRQERIAKVGDNSLRPYLLWLLSPADS